MLSQPFKPAKGVLIQPAISAHEIGLAFVAALVTCAASFARTEAGTCEDNGNSYYTSKRRSANTNGYRVRSLSQSIDEDGQKSLASLST